MSSDAWSMQILIFGLSFLGIAVNLYALVFRHQKPPISVELDKLGGETVSVLARYLNRAVTSATWLTYATVVASLIITVGTMVRNYYSLPLAYENAPGWFPALLVLVYVAFYGLIFLPGIHLYTFVWGLRRLIDTIKTRQGYRQDDGETRREARREAK